MELSATLRHDSRVIPRTGDHWVWLFGLAALFAWQGWMTLVLFGAERDLGVLADSLGNRPALWIAVTGLIGQAIVISCSQLRHARLPDADAQFTA